MYSIGDSVVDIKASSTLGDFSMASRAGRWVVFYFYPKDNTSGCTLEARNFSAARETFAAEGCDIVGVSRDSVKTHQGFCTRQELTIELVSDKDEALCTAFDVIKPKVMYGKPCRGIVRSTFLINPEGVIVREWRGVKVPGHVEAVLAALREEKAKA